MTTIQIVDFVRDLLNEPLDPSRTFPDNSSNFYRDATLLNYLNREQQTIANIITQADENYFVTSTVISLTNGTDEYTLHSAVIKIKRVEWISPDPLDPEEICPISFNDKDSGWSAWENASGSGQISTYTLKDNSIIFRPVPRVSTASAVRYYFIKMLPDLSTGSSISEIPETYHEVLCWGVYKRALAQQEGAEASLAFALGQYKEQVENLRQFIEDRQLQKPRYVKRNKYRR